MPHLKKISKYKLKFKIKPWITPALQKPISIKNALFKRYIKLKSPVKKKEVHQQYKSCRNLLSTLMEKSKQNYYEQLFKNNLKNLKNRWKGIRSLIAIKNSSASNMHMLTHKGATVTDPLHIVNIFNDYFSSIAEKTKANIKFSNKSFQDFLHHPNEDSLFITLTDANEVNLIISSLNSDKSTGPNSLPTKILKLLKNEISTHLVDIFNLSFSSGVFPSILKIGKVIPVHKKESKLFYSNCRPISLLSNIDKIIEKITYNRIYKFLDKNNIIYSLQLGFRQHYSTSYALLNLTEAIMKALDDGNFACGIFVDLHKAFDTADESILLSKLCHYGIRGLTNKWFESYLANRKQFVSINGFVSSNSSIGSGVPQGFALGPLLFLL